jgi:hypothetical protein
VSVQCEKSGNASADTPCACNEVFCLFHYS